jgi:predicted secreted protein
MTKVAGTDIYLKVNTGTEGSPVWTKVGGQRDASMTPNLGSYDLTDKDSQGWEEPLPANRSIDIEFDSFLIENDAGYLEMIKGFWERKVLMLQLITPTKAFQGKFILSKGPYKAPEGGAATVSFSLKSTGAVTMS